ncbi:MAG: hypothetical protein ACKVX7_19845 [Planctomycetota bacterium]
MDTVTYPDPQVARFLSERFVCFKLNVFEKHPDFKEAAGNNKFPWNPAFVFSDARRREFRKFIGWLPAQSFLAELRLVVGLSDVHQGRFAEAEATFAGIGADHGKSEVAPEALYWHGISAFLARKRDMSALRASWVELLRRYPGTRFATHASVIEDHHE